MERFGRDTGDVVGVRVPSQLQLEPFGWISTSGILERRGGASRLQSIIFFHLVSSCISILSYRYCLLIIHTHILNTVIQGNLDDTEGQSVNLFNATRLNSPWYRTHPISPAKGITARSIIVAQQSSLCSCSFLFPHDHDLRADSRAMDDVLIATAEP